MPKKADPHRAFVTAWREYGEAWLTKDVDLVGPEDAWFKACKSKRFWDDASLPPENPAHRREVKYNYKPPKRKRAKPRIVTVKVLTGIGRDLVEWVGPKDDSRPATQRNREKEFRLRMERELEEYKEWLGKDEWPLAV